MVKILRQCLVAGRLIFLLSAPVYSQNEFSIIRTAISNSMLEDDPDSLLNNATSGLMASLQKDGAWPGIDYANPRRTYWPANEHLVRTETITKAFVKNSSRYYADVNVYKAIVTALQYWYDRDYSSSNWWYNQISAPQLLGGILVLLKQGPEQLPVLLQDKLLVRMNRGEMWRQTGANKVDIALHNIYRASVKEDVALMDSAVQEAFQPIALTSGEGLQYDYSNMQHGRQMMISSYGQVFVDAEYKIASFLQGTRYAIPADKLKLLSTFFYEVFLKALRGSYMDFNTEGRGISRRDILDKRIVVDKRGMTKLLRIAMRLDSSHESYLMAAEKRCRQDAPASYKVSPSHIHFWKADYDLHLRPGYSFNVRTVSNRTLRTETGNDENLLGNFLPDGATNIQRRGGEYNNIQPIWEWDKIPGVTNRDYNTDEGTKIRKDWGLPGTTAFAGGAGDSLYGAAAYDLQYDSVSAKKAWFFFDKEIVCLGAGISSKAAGAVTTTVNQCWLNGPVRLPAINNTMKNNSVTRLENPTWVWHDSIGYFFPAGGSLTVSNQIQTGSWHRINKSQAIEEMAGSVFKLWFIHKARPANSSYAYVVVPGIGSEKKMSSYKMRGIQIEQNTAFLQAVTHTELDMLQVVFYKGGTLKTADAEVTADKPCIIYLKNMHHKKPVLYIADPTQQNDSIQVTVQVNNNKPLQLQCILPQGEYAGSTAQFIIGN
ncbi:MAG: polysaccharide lyase family 8 super-sandwich domain-containing protein [Chitinophagaceae bacterium]